MKKLPRAAAFILILSLLLGTVIPAYAAVIEPSSDFYITDYTQSCVISDSTKQYIAAMNRQLEEQTGAQIVVAVVDFIDGADIENYTYEMYNEWKIGGNEQNNGLLILLVIGEQNYWGVQGAGISEALTASLIAEYFNTYLEEDFASAHYDSGVRSVFDAFLNWYSDYYSVTLNVPQGMDISEQTDEPVIPYLPSSNTETVEEVEENHTESILAVGFLLGKIAKWFLICLAAVFILVMLFMLLRNRRRYSNSIRTGLFASLFRQSNTRPVPPRNEPVNKYNSLYRNPSPDGQYHYSKPTNGLTYVKPEYKSGYSRDFHNQKPDMKRPYRQNPGAQPSKNKYDNLYRFNARPGVNIHAPNGSRPMGFGSGSRPNSSSPFNSHSSSSFHFGGGGFSRGGGAGRTNTGFRSSQTRSSFTRGSSVPGTGGGGFSRGGGAGRHR